LVTSVDKFAVFLESMNNTLEPMNNTLRRFTLDLEPSFQLRLKVIAALKGVSMREYCLLPIEMQLAKDEADGELTLPLKGHKYPKS